MEECIQANGVCRRFLGQPVIREVSLKVARGEFCLLVGPNGAGKSTFLRILSGLLRADSGSVHIGDTSILSLSSQRRRTELQYLGHESQQFSQLTTAESLQLRCALQQIPLLENALDDWGLAKQRDKRVSELSRGQTQKLALCCTLASRCKFILLDEPTSSLDDRSVEVLLRQLQSRRDEGSGILLATHDIARLKSSASRVVLFKDGSLVSDSSQEGSSLDEVLQQYHACNR